MSYDDVIQYIYYIHDTYIYIYNIIYITSPSSLASLPGLLCSDDGFLAASWIQDAIRWAAGNATLQRYYEMAARSVTTVWTPQEPWWSPKMARIWVIWVIYMILYDFIWRYTVFIVTELVSWGLF